jgi:hypothetical protein
MPFIRIHTNIEVSESSGVLKKLSSLAAEKIGKPEA